MADEMMTKAAAMRGDGQMTMIHRIALAIDKAAGTYSEDVSCWYDHARAALEAMREPTDAMKVAGGIAWEDEFFGQHGIIFDAAGRAWTAQVSAALSEADDPLTKAKGIAAA